MSNGWRSGFRKGHESAKVRSWWNFIGGGFLIVGLGVALELPVAWYWKIVIYIVGAGVVGPLETTRRR